MANIQVKSFITHKRGETDVDIQDSIAYDLECGCFALSDGVTNSFLPKILSDLLTSTYIDGKGKSIFPPPSMPECFMTERNHYMDSLDEDMRLMEEMVEEEFHVGAATFVGLTMNGDEFSWQILGDSCLFILPEDGRMRCFCSMTVKVSPQWQLDVQFDNHPRQIHSDGIVVGEWIKGKRNITSGWAILASDAISNWIIQQWNEGRDIITELWNLHDNEVFESFVEQEYQEHRLKSDDESVILIRIGQQEEIAEIPVVPDTPELSEKSESPEPSEPTELIESPEPSESSEPSESPVISESPLISDSSENSVSSEPIIEDDEFDYSGYSQ